MSKRQHTPAYPAELRERGVLLFRENRVNYCPSSDNLGQPSAFRFGGSGSFLIEFMCFQFGGASAA